MNSHERFRSDVSNSIYFANSSHYPLVMNKQSLLPYYFLHSGRNRFACRGHCVMSRQLSLFYLTLLLLIVLGGIFFAFDARYLTISLSPAIPAVGGALFLFVLFVLLRTSLSDPGILPRATIMEVQFIEGEWNLTTFCGVHFLIFIFKFLFPLY